MMKQMKMGKRVLKQWKKAAALALLSVSLAVTGGASFFDQSVVYADSSTTIASAQARLDNHNSNLQTLYRLSEEDTASLNKICNDAKAFLSNNPDMSADEIDMYVNEIKNSMSEFAARNAMPDEPLLSTSEYISLYSGMQTPVATYGQKCSIILPVINYCEENINNIVVTPKISNDTSVWPFEIARSDYSQVILVLPGNESSDTLYDNRQEVSWTFTTRSEIASGYYPVSFRVSYEWNGTYQETELTVYVKVNGSPEVDEEENEGDDGGRVSTPRIIVTGFDTNPEMVFAGDVFTLTLHIQNTSSDMTVSNILFDLQAAVTGGDSAGGTAGVAAFLPTSGSSTIFCNSIAPNQTIDISIEMTARADLSQKPYVLNVSMNYEDAKANPYSQEANVSIPIYQESKFELSTIEVMPGAIGTYEESNIMFSIYNTGKTTLYNVQVKFDQDMVSGGDVFLGRLDPGATGYVDTMVMGIMPNGGTITAHITYEDESGAVATFDKEIDLFIYEMSFDDPGMMGDEWMYDDPFMTGDEEGGSSNTTLYIIIGAAVGAIIIAVIVLIVVRKSSKKKKLLKELENEADDDEIL